VKKVLEANGGGYIDQVDSLSLITLPVLAASYQENAESCLIVTSCDAVVHIVTVLLLCASH
jgi:hypothetical protein